MLKKSNLFPSNQDELIFNYKEIYDYKFIDMFDNISD